MDYPVLFTEYSLPGGLVLKNRLVMAPMTRCFSDKNLAPTEAMVAYYQRRADAGLIVTEATLIEARGQGYPDTPGIFSDIQIQAWREVTDAVHLAGGRIFCQLWHTGRMAHSYYTGLPPVAPSTVRLDGLLPRAQNLSYEEPRSLEPGEIEDLQASFVQAACNAITAGFDGVELHAANGYLIDQFLHQHTNQRMDKYGGNAENRSRFALEVIDAVAAAIGSHCVGIRLSPQAYINLNYRDGDEETFDYLLDGLNRRSIAYVHVAAFDAERRYSYLGGRPVDYVRQRYSGTVIGSGGFTPEGAEINLLEQCLDLVALGRSFIANPDLVSRIQAGKKLNTYDESLLATLL